MEELESRRDMLEAALDQADEGTLETPEEKEIEVNDDLIETENEARDEQGKFIEKDEPESSTLEEVEPEEPVEEVKRPTTWKK